MQKLEAGKDFDARLFAETIKGSFSNFPDYRRNQKRILYPIWYLSLVVLCGFFCGCNTIEEIAEYAQLQEEWFSSLLGEPVSAPSHGSLWWFLVKTPSNALKSHLQQWFSKIPGSFGDHPKWRWLRKKRLRAQCCQTLHRKSQKRASPI